MGKPRELLLQQIRQAMDAGHNLDLVQVDVAFSRAGNLVKNRPGWAAVCTCGWKGRPRPTRNGALASSMLHIGELAAAGFPPALSPGEADTPDRVNLPHRAASGL